MRADQRCSSDGTVSHGRGRRRHYWRIGRAQVRVIGMSRRGRDIDEAMCRIVRGPEGREEHDQRFVRANRFESQS